MTISEVLITVLIMSLVTIGVAIGVSSSVRVYRDSVEFSNAQTLSSTLSESVMDELRYASGIGEETPNPTFTSTNYGDGISIVTSGDGKLQVRIPQGASSTDYPLVGSGAYDGMTAAVEYSYNDAAGVFEVTLTVTDKSGNEHENTFSVRSLSETLK